ncbi:hypothetical protein SAMN06297129_1953 [Pseudooceanicola antarcticus]|uniref:Uncharacterized protein n=1 Tax=Pseudooceanicola antarcticus TaxID=1247613 RepID=A0A285IS54_9RHOB|nr:hypothetical protein [Pseudooceanicola antarcticus]SNY50822.1 hypothetical protein SAMN06297129_1953 [Pseudooceanicola antarcticus]
MRPILTTLSALLGALVPALAPSQVQAVSPIAEVICDQTPRLENRLKTTMNSEREGLGLRGPEQVMELWTTPGGDWTMVVTYATGKSCIVAMGEAWQGGLRAQDPT